MKRVLFLLIFVGINIYPIKAQSQNCEWEDLKYSKHPYYRMCLKDSRSERGFLFLFIEKLSNVKIRVQLDLVRKERIIQTFTVRIVRGFPKRSSSTIVNSGMHGEVYPLRFKESYKDYWNLEFKQYATCLPKDLKKFFR